jgi:aspartate aminotransferase
MDTGMSPLSQLAETLIGSEIVRLGNEISARVRQGEQIYNYTIGDFDPGIFPIPAELEENIVTAYRNHYTNYPPGDGVLELRQAVADFVQTHQGPEYTPGEVLIAGGGRPLIYAMFRAVVDRGDKVIYAVPSWNNNHYTHMNGGEHCVIPALPENRFMPTAADIAPHIPGAALLCLCTPQNPTGTTLAREELEQICDLVLEENRRRGAGKKKLYVLFDQMYCMLSYGATQHHNPVSLRPEMKEYTLFIDGISKAFAATGVRVGWALGPAYLIGKMKALLSHIGAWSPMAEQKATAQFLTNREAVESFLNGFRKALEERLWRIYRGVSEMKAKGLPIDAIEPEAAIYMTIKLDLKGRRAGNRLLTTQQEVTTYLLDEARLAIVPFSSFGAEKDAPWYRLSIGTCRQEDIDPMLAGLEAALQKIS